jgi:hypothetical protein
MTGAETPLVVGERYPIWIEATGATGLEGAATATGRIWRFTHRDATYIALHFRSFDLPPEHRLIISDSAGSQSYTMVGRGKLEAGTFWARHIKGDTIVLELVTGGHGGSAPGFVKDPSFVVDEYAAGFVDLGGGALEAICGADDKENAICYESSHPTEYGRARAVARLLIQGSSLCTGWLVSQDNHLLTNEHCITSATAALNTDYEFMAEAPTCGSGNCQLCWPGIVFDGANFIQDNAGLDYALVQITSGDPAGTYGYLEIDDRDAVVGEQIYIPQHPGGRAKELGIFSSASQDAGGICRVYSIDEPPCSGSGYSDVGYYCDTEGGSSGSPVIASSSHKVIALHHCALCPNRGVPIDLVYAEISEYLGSCGDGTCSPSEDSCTCPADCGSPPSAETSCTDGIDNDCDSFTDCDDADCTGDPACVCDSDGTCETGEDCNNCSSDCISGAGGAECGNGMCEAGNGEDCRSCPADCNGVSTGKPSGRYCCGAETDCSDSRCTAGGLQCTNDPVSGDPYCCGDLVCEGDEDVFNCSIDCGSAPFCGDGSCDAGEDECSCPTDCGFPPGNETPNITCQDGIDNDCDDLADCLDADCATDPACDCLPPDALCTADDECCSNKCVGRPGAKRCK